MCYFTFLALSIALLPITPNAYISNRGNAYDSTIRFYTGSTLADYATYDLALAENVADHSHFNLTRSNMIFFHGWRQDPGSTSIEVLLNAYLINGTFNILALDWSETASNNRYEAVVQRVEPLAHAVAQFIDRLNTQKGVLFSKIHLVGHSLGAHLAGSVGKYTKRWSGRTKLIDRITGLDPAIIGNDFLQWRHARFVDIIHTDANGFGTRLNTGHVDFWPNNGVAVQPGCPSVMTYPGCSHVRSILLYAESVQRANRSGNFLSTNNANADIVIEMGLNCPTSNVQGVYSLDTNGGSWYSQS